jgi:hypothetical protein
MLVAMRALFSDVRAPIALASLTMPALHVPFVAVVVITTPLLPSLPQFLVPPLPLGPTTPLLLSTPSPLSIQCRLPLIFPITIRHRPVRRYVHAQQTHQQPPTALTHRPYGISSVVPKRVAPNLLPLTQPLPPLLPYHWLLQLPLLHIPFPSPPLLRPLPPPHQLPTPTRMHLLSPLHQHQPSPKIAHNPVCTSC